jgi:hypothetical protein
MFPLVVLVFGGNARMSVRKLRRSMLSRHETNLSNYQAMRVAHSNITTKIVCPVSRCGSSLYRITRVTQTAAGITPRIARAAGLGRHHELFLCHNCGCVWRRDFDIDQLKYTSVILGG